MNEPEVFPVIFFENLAKALDRLVMVHCDSTRSFQTNVPICSMDEFFLPLSAFDYSAAAKNGCGVLKAGCFTGHVREYVLFSITSLMCHSLPPPDFPNNNQFAIHFHNFLNAGYLLSSESIICKFPYADGSRLLADWSVGLVDGFTKVLLMLSIIAFCVELELTEEQLEDPILTKTLASFRFIRCSYTHYENPSHHFLNSLRALPAMLCTSKVVPSVLVDFA